MSQTAKARKGCKSRLLIRACLSQVQAQPFLPLWGNYSSCVAWRQQGPQAQLVCNTTQVAVNPLAPTPTFPPSSPHQQRDRNQTNRNLLKVYKSGMKNKDSSHVFTPSLLPLQEWGDETWGCAITRLLDWVLNMRDPRQVAFDFVSLPFLLLLHVFCILRHQRGDSGAYKVCLQTRKHNKPWKQTGHLTNVKLYSVGLLQQAENKWFLPNLQHNI